MKSLSDFTSLKRIVARALTFLLCMIWFMSHEGLAQSRKYISQFSQLQGYYNPALTAYEGSMVKGLVRNQWAGWEGTPKTLFVSAELDFADMGGSGQLGKNAIGVNLLSDEYGAFRETELILSYSTRIRLSEQAGLRLGAGLNFNSIRLDGNSLTTEQGNDPIVMQYIGGFANMSVVDFNLGLALTHPNYYVSYGVHNVNKGSISRGDVFMDTKPMVNIVQAGFRNGLTENLMLIFNGMYRNQSDLPDNIELNMKFLFYDRFWLGAGHRVNYANNLQFGLVLDKFRLGYGYEIPILNSYLLPNATHELMLTFSVFGTREGDRALIW